MNIPALNRSPKDIMSTEFLMLLTCFILCAEALNYYFIHEQTFLELFNSVGYFVIVLFSAIFVVSIGAPVAKTIIMLIIGVLGHFGILKDKTEYSKSHTDLYALKDTALLTKDKVLFDYWRYIVSENEKSRFVTKLCFTNLVFFLCVSMQINGGIASFIVSKVSSQNIVYEAGGTLSLLVLLLGAWLYINDEETLIDKKYLTHKASFEEYKTRSDAIKAANVANENTQKEAIDGNFHY
jgi:hypothetical protein